jgi:hypothetical protein
MKLDFQSARNACAKYNGVLASIHSRQEFDAIYGKSGRDVYIGLWVPTGQKGDPYVNEDGTQPDWAAWHSSNVNWGACTTTEYLCCSWTGFWRQSCSFIASGYICEIATMKWERLKSDMALIANAQIMKNYTATLEILNDVQVKVNELYENFFENYTMVMEYKIMKNIKVY